MRLRGRKGIREDLERQTDLVVLEPQRYKGKWRDFFGNDNPIHVELGMGKGIFISEMSQRFPGINFIGVDMYDELIRRASEKARRLRQPEEQAENQEGQTEALHDAPSTGERWNLALVVANIQYISDIFDKDEIERVYLNFSDPWPKTRHAHRRLTHPGFVRKYLGFLNERGEIHLKTDSRLLFEYSLNSFADMGLRMRNISLDLHGEGIREDLVMTEYEKKFVERGMNIHRCEVVTGRLALQEHVRRLEEKSAR